MKLTPVGSLLIEQARWQNAAVQAVKDAGLADNANEQDVWDALEAAGLNSGTQRPPVKDLTAHQPSKPRRYRPASYWQARVESLARRIDEIDRKRAAAENPDRAAAWTAFDKGRNKSRAETDEIRRERRQVLSKQLATARFRLNNAIARSERDSA